MDCERKPTSINTISSHRMVSRTSGSHAHIFWRQEAENMPKTRPDMIYNFLLRGSRVREKPTSAGNHVNYSSKNMELYAVFRAPKYGQKSGKYAIFFLRWARRRIVGFEDFWKKQGTRPADSPWSSRNGDDTSTPYVWT